MRLEWISNHWTILAFVFVAGGTYALQTEQIENIEDVIVRQAEIVTKQQKFNEQVIRIEEQVKATKAAQDSMDKKLDLLIKMRMEDR